MATYTFTSETLRLACAALARVAYDDGCQPAFVINWKEILARFACKDDYEEPCGCPACGQGSLPNRDQARGLIGSIVVCSGCGISFIVKEIPEDWSKAPIFQKV